MIRRAAVVLLLALGIAGVACADPLTTYEFVGDANPFEICCNWYVTGNWSPTPRELDPGKGGPMVGDGAWIHTGAIVVFGAMQGFTGSLNSGAELVRIDSGGKLILSQNYNGVGSTFHLTNDTSSSGGGRIENGGLVQIDAILQTGYGSRLVGLADGTSGTITLNGPDAKIVGAGPLYFENQVLNGTGTVGDNLDAVWIDAKSTIDANRNGQVLQFRNDGEIVNSGVLQASNGGVLSIYHTVIGNTGGGSVRAGTGSEVRIGGGGAAENYVFDGTFLTEGTGKIVVDDHLTIVGVTNTGALVVPDGANLTLNGATSNTGSINLGINSHLWGTGTDPALAGGGTVTAAGGHLHGPLINQDNIVQGSVTFHSSITNNGTILAHDGETMWVDDAVLNNQGTIRVELGGGLGFSGGAYSPTMANFVDPGWTGVGTLTGGTWQIAGALQTNGRSISANAAHIIMDGPGAQFLNGSANALAPLSTNAAAGNFTIRNGYNFTSQGNFTNQGRVEIGAGSDFLAGPGGSAQYIQTAGGTTLLNGRLYAASLDLAGTLSGSGELHAATLLRGELNPGSSPGTVTIFGDMTLTDSSVLDFEVASTSSYDRLVVNGSLVLDGIFNLSAIDGYTPHAGDVFDLISWTGSASGAFDAIYLPSFAGYRFVYELDSNDFLVHVEQAGDGVVPEPSTFVIAGLGLLALGAKLRRRQA